MPKISAKHPGWVKSNNHWIQSQGWETLLGVVLFLAGCALLWDAFDGRGRKLPWPASGLAPW